MYSLEVMNIGVNFMLSVQRRVIWGLHNEG